jgi:hypothetical protein
MKKIYILTFYLFTSIFVFAQKERSFGMSTHFGTFSLQKTEAKSDENQNYYYNLSSGINVNQRFYFQKYFGKRIGLSAALGAHFSNYDLNYNQKFINEGVVYYEISSNLKVLEYGLNFPIKALFRVNSRWPTFSVGIIPTYNLKTIGGGGNSQNIFIECCFGCPDPTPSEKRYQTLYTSAIQYRLKTGTTFGLEFTTSERKNTLQNFQQVFSGHAITDHKVKERYPFYLQSIGFFVAQDLVFR